MTGVFSSNLEDELMLDDFDLDGICDSWEVPLTQSQVPAVTPLELQMEVDAMRRQLRQSPDIYESHLMPLPEEIQDFHQGEMQSRYSLQHSITGMTRVSTPELDVQTPKVNLVLDSSAVRLDTRFCPKPMMTVLSSQVIHAPHPVVHEIDDPRHEKHEPYDQMDMAWHQHGDHSPHILYPADYGVCQYTPTDVSLMSKTPEAHALEGEFSRLMNVDYDGFVHPCESSGYSLVFPGDPVEDERGGKVLRKNTDGEKHPMADNSLCNTPPPERRLAPGQIGSRSTEIRKIQSMSEADICEYVKTVAPHLQNNAWEEVVKETNFEERLQKAEQKMQEHTQELEKIKKEVSEGKIDPAIGQEMMRKVYNRREAAASRAKREQGLVKAAIKKRTLEKICGWMREHLFGNSELFSQNSLDSDVRRSRSDGTRTHV